MQRFLFILALLLSGCAYKFGYVQRDLPGGYSQLAVPVFANQTSEVGIEGYFANALIRQFSRSRVAKIVAKESAPVFVEGVITSVKYTPSAQVKGGQDNVLNLPNNTALTTEYQVLVTADVNLVRSADKKVLWKSSFQVERVYTAPQVGLGVINSVNPLYNQSARMEVIELAAQDMMADAHDRMTENF